VGWERVQYPRMPCLSHARGGDARGGHVGRYGQCLGGRWSIPVPVTRCTSPPNNPTPRSIPPPTTMSPLLTRTTPTFLLCINSKSSESKSGDAKRQAGDKKTWTGKLKGGAAAKKVRLPPLCAHTCRCCCCTQPLHRNTGSQCSCVCGVCGTAVPTPPTTTRPHPHHITSHHITRRLRKNRMRLHTTTRSRRSCG
jgi:hypothetical protein